MNLVVYARFVIEPSAIDSITLAKESRKDILRMTHKAGASHVGSALSVIDILSVVYSGGLRIPEDKVILSKGHAASALYAVLANSGLMNRDLLKDFCVDGTKLGGHVSHQGNDMIELSTGSLGHGLPYGVGIALAQKLKGNDNLTLVIASDGECDEGTTWESALIANHFNLGNLILFIDRNGLQSLTTTEDTIALEPLGEKWRAFGWKVIEINGNSHSEISDALSMHNRQNQNKPTCIIGKTIKGYGVKFMENSIRWHYKSVNSEEFEQAMLEIEERF